MNDETSLRDETKKDPETLEREINQTRAEMNQTLDALERKLTPGQLLDECLSFLGKNTSEVASNLGNSIRENPVPMMLTAIGISWMMFSPGRGASTKPYHDYTGDADYGDNSYSSEPGALSKTRDKIQAATESARSQLTSSKDAVVETVNKTATLAQSGAIRAREGISSLLQEQPLVIGALGVALGAAIGAALPSTEQEDRLMGSVRDQTLKEVTQRGAEQYEHARETVKKAAEEVQDAVFGHTARQT